MPRRGELNRRLHNALHACRYARAHWLALEQRRRLRVYLCLRRLRESMGAERFDAEYRALNEENTHAARRLPAGPPRPAAGAAAHGAPRG